MKKLMVAAAAAAMIVGAEAGEIYQDKCGVGDCYAAYNFTATLKTTGLKNKGVRGDTCGTCGSCTYRAQKSVKYVGYIYGSDDSFCEDCVTELPDTFICWNPTEKEDVDADLHIVIGSIGKEGAKTIEAYGDLGETGNDIWMKLAGFGTMAGKVTKDVCGGVTANAYPKTISGGIAGFRTLADEDDCAWDICGNGVLDHTAAYGTWKIAYNAGIAKKLSKNGGDISAAVKIPAFASGDELACDTNIEE